MREQDARRSAPGGTEAEAQAKKGEEEKAKHYRKIRSAEIRREEEAPDEFGDDTEISKTVVREAPRMSATKIVRGTPENPPSVEAVMKKADDEEIQRILNNIKGMPEELLDA